MKTSRSIGLAVLLLFTAAFNQVSIGQTDQTDSSLAPKVTLPNPEAARNALERAIGKIAQPERYLLQYKLQPDAEWCWDCEQSTSTRTRMAGTSQTSTARSKWQTVWKVNKIDTIGNMNFESRVESFTMWQQIDDKPPTSIDSSASGPVPDEFLSIADKLKPRPSQFSITPDGNVVRRESSTNQKLVGYSDIAVPLPPDRITPGFQWHKNRELTATDEDKCKVRLAIRTNYELTKVVDNRAYLSFRTEVLTPGLSPAIRSQIMQNMTQGYIIFDLELGLPVYRETEWNEKVQAFSGNDSYLMYLAKTVEKLKPPAAEVVAVRPASKTTLTSQLLAPLPVEMAESSEKSTPRKESASADSTTGGTEASDKK